MGGLEGIFHILKNIPTSRVAPKGDWWWVRVLAGSNRKPQICNSCEKVQTFKLFFFQTVG